MVVYSVSWKRDDDLAKGTSKGRPLKKQYDLHFTVLCNNSKEAAACLEFIFPLHFGYHCGFTIEDGVVSMSRTKLDSRKFFFGYIFMDSMKRPLDVSDLTSGYLEIPRTHYYKKPLFD